MSIVTSTTFTTIPGPDNQLLTRTVLLINPPNTSQTPATTRTLIPGGSTVDIYTTYIEDPAAPGQFSPSPVTTTYGSSTASTTTSQTSTSTDSATTTATPAPAPSEQTSTTASAPATESSTSPTVSSTPTTSNVSTASPTPSNPNSSSNGGSNGVSSGALAGAVVGSIIGTALLAILLAYLFLRRRRATPSNQLEPDPDSAPKDAQFMSGKSTPESFIASIIPHPADDETVRSRILTLLDQASLHVDNYYTPSATPPPLPGDAVARLSNYHTDSMPASVVTMLSHRSIQRQVIRHILIHKLLQSISPSGGGALLPPLFAAQPRLQRSLSSPTAAEALFTWRMLTAHLHREAKHHEDLAQSISRQQAARDFAAGFTAAFAPYALPSLAETDRVMHLESVASAAAELGSWLFAQPCAFEFVWGKAQDKITVVPGVVKVGDECGERLGTPLVLIEGEDVKIAGVVEGV